METRPQGSIKTGLMKIVVTGPESTGKSTLAAQLADYYHTVYIPEYAREYIGHLDRPYEYTDLEHIARRQVDDIKTLAPKANRFLFLDTYLIITKVWFDVVYKKCPQWVIDEIETSDIDLFLLCTTDLPWEPDTVRENGGEMREQLFHLYKAELEHFGFSYSIVEGFGKKRLNNAIFSIEDFIKQR
jgi:NadR type nicotinamide-nucleotide adenylyltransferase